MNARTPISRDTLRLAAIALIIAPLISMADPLDALTPPTVVGEAAASPRPPAPPPPPAGSVVVAKIPWGKGPGQAGFYNESTPGFDEIAPMGPQGIAVASDGRIAVADTFNNRIMLLDPDGSVGETVTSSALLLPWVLGFTPDHDLLVGMGNPVSVLLLGKGGRVLTRWGAGGGVGGDELLRQIAAVALDSQGRLVVADLGRNSIGVIDPSGHVVARMPWVGTGMCLDADNVVDLDFSDADGYSLRVRRLDGTVVSRAPLTGAGHEGGRIVGRVGAGRYAVRFAPMSTPGAMSIAIFDAQGKQVKAIGALPHFAADQSAAAGPDGSLVWLQDDAGAAPSGVVTVRKLH